MSAPVPDVESDGEPQLRRVETIGVVASAELRERQLAATLPIGK